MQVTARPVRATFRLGTILLIVNLTILVLPLGSILFFRIYENALVQQTESELISQAAFISPIYQREVQNALVSGQIYGLPLTLPEPENDDDYYRPIPAELDLSQDQLLPPRPDGVVPQSPADALALQTGKNLSTVLTEAQRTALSGIRILDYNGITVAGGNEIGLSFAHIPEVKTALEGANASVLRQRISDEPRPPIASISRGTDIRVFIAVPIIYDSHLWGVVYLSRTPQNILKHLYADRGKVALIGFSLLAVTLLLAFFTSRTIAKPINELIAKTQAAAEGNGAGVEPLASPVTKEVDLLSQSFSTMARSLNERSDYIRQFATHVSHEFKTPLTSIQGAAELLLDHEEMTDEERKKFLTNIINDSDRLESLVKRLLELARADNIAPSAEVSHLKSVLDRLSRRYGPQGLAINDKSSGAHALIISQDCLEDILSNLFDNSLQHGATEASVSVTPGYDRSTIVVSDNGNGISDANKEKIFSPFFTTRREQGGTGLGLGIVKSLVEAHDGSIALSQNTNGAAFAINLPAAAGT